MQGGPSPWEGMYCLPYDKFGKAGKLMWWTFQDGPDGIPELLKACTGVSPTTQPFATDALGTLVHLGPLVDPLRQRADLVGRLRTLVMSHTVYPHAPAHVLAVTGSATSSPRCAGLGAAVQRRGLAQYGASQPLPWAYNILSDYNPYAGADNIGVHPSETRPLSITIDSLGNAFQGIAEYNQDFSATGTASALADALHAQAVQRMTRPGEAFPTRAPVIANYQAAQQQLGQAVALLDVLTPAALAGPAGASCGTNYAFDNTHAMLTAAVKLLKLDANAPQYIALQDTCFRSPTTFQMYDFHDDFAPLVTLQMPYFYQRLVDILAQPGEVAPGKLNLDDTLVVVNAEFGRSPELVGTGRRHYPTAYTASLLGGPVGTAQQGIVGGIDINGQPVKPVTPAELRMAILVALGIWPFEVDLFSYTQVHGAQNEQDALLRLKGEILGVPT